MPAILRIFVYQILASLVVLGLCGSYDQGAGRWGRHVDLEHDAVQTLWEVYAEQPIDCDAAGHRHYEIESYVVYRLHFRGVRYRLRMYCATPKRTQMAHQNR